MTCGAGETLSFEDTSFLMVNKDSNGAAVTTYFVSKYNMDDTQVGCNDILGYTIVTFEGSQQPLFTSMQVLPFEADTNRMMSRIVENITGNQNIVRVAETYLHECGHQCGLLHDSDAPDCENDTTTAHRQGDEPGCRRSPRVHPLPMVHGATELVYDVAVPDAVHAGARAAGFRFEPSAAAGRCRNCEWWSRWLKPWGQPDG